MDRNDQEDLLLEPFCQVTSNVKRSVTRKAEVGREGVPVSYCNLLPLPTKETKELISSTKSEDKADLRLLADWFKLLKK